MCRGKVGPPGNGARVGIAAGSLGNPRVGFQHPSGPGDAEPARSDAYQVRPGYSVYLPGVELSPANSGRRSSVPRGVRDRSHHEGHFIYVRFKV